MPLAQAIATMVRDGTALDRAARAVAVHPDSIYAALGEATKTRQALDDGSLAPSDLTPYQTAALDFSEVVNAARHQALAEREAIMGQLARGGLVKTKRVSTTDADGNVTLRVEQEVLPPSEGMLRWYAERRHPEEYGLVERREIALVDTGAVVQTASPLDRLAQALEEIERRRTEGARVIEAHVTDDAESA